MKELPSNNPPPQRSSPTPRKRPRDSNDDEGFKDNETITINFKQQNTTNNDKNNNPLTANKLGLPPPKGTTRTSSTSSTCSSIDSNSSSKQEENNNSTNMKIATTTTTESAPIINALKENVKHAISSSSSTTTNRPPSQQEDDKVLRAYWETKLGMPLVEEAIKVYNSMLHDDDDQLIRILKARNHDIPQTTELFLEQVRFRTKWQPRSISPASIPNALPSGAWRLCGYSREGYIISNYKLQLWNPDDYGEQTTEQQLKDAVDEYTRYSIYMTELMIRNMKPGKQKFIFLFDLKGFTIRLAFRKNVRMMIAKLIYVAQTQYPERLYKMFLMNPPYGFTSAWKAIQKLLDASTRSKINFVNLNNTNDKNKITEEISPDVLCHEYGGNHPEYLVPC